MSSTRSPFRYENTVALAFGSDFSFEVARLNGTLPITLSRVRSLSERHRRIFVLTPDSVSFKRLLPPTVDHIPLSKWKWSPGAAAFVLKATLFSIIAGVPALVRLRKNVDAVVVTPLFPATWIIHHLTKLPIVLCLSYYPGWHPSFGLADFFKKLLYVATTRSALSVSDLVIVPNDALRKLALHFGRKKDGVIIGKRFLVNEELLRPYQPKGILKSEFHITSDSAVLMYHGRLARLKGLDCLLRAMVRLENSGEFHLFLIGRGPDETRLRKLAEHLGISNLVHFTGSVSNTSIREYLAEADVYVFPSLSEGHPKSLLEAMLMAKPIVASRAEGVTELLNHGQDALLFEPSRPDDLAMKVLEIVRNKELAERLGNNARLRATEMARDQAPEFFECI